MPSRALPLCSLLPAALLAASSAGCGVRTPLSVDRDGSVPPMPLSDAGRDAGRDSGDTGLPDGGSCIIALDCNDGRFCNGLELCVGGRCVAGTVPSCDDFVDCTIDRCAESSDSCTSTPNDALCPGGFCDPFSGCVGRACVNDSECNDGRACNGLEICAPDGVCIGGIDMPPCDDFIDCTIDSCEEPGICSHSPDHTRCFAPGTRCDATIGCVSGGCMSDFECDDGRICNGFERCVRGACTSGGPTIACNDGIDCTRDECSDFAGGCVSTPDNSLCPMGELCTPGVGCQRRRCMRDFECDDGSICNGIELCDRRAGACRAGVPPNCDDFQTCTIDRCLDVAGGCFSEPRSAREVCANGIDDDCDLRFDCEDFDCAGTAGCPSCIPEADFEFACGDFRDQDCDRLIDCGDPDCTGAFECCVPRSRTELDCFDGTDDDCDFSIDCGDPDCFAVCVPPEECGNRFDDDGDGLIDCADFDCRFDFRCRRDGGPRDGGGPFDSGPRDGGGDSGPTAGEIGVAQCTNALDDDRDGRSDCRDPDCSPFGVTGECCNDIDDDGDGTVDVFTCRCFDDSTCVGVGDLDQVCWEGSFAVCAPRCNFYGGDSFCRMYLPEMPRCNVMTGECMP